MTTPTTGETFSEALARLLQDVDPNVAASVTDMANGAVDVLTCSLSAARREIEGLREARLRLSEEVRLAKLHIRDSNPTDREYTDDEPLFLWVHGYYKSIAADSSRHETALRDEVKQLREVLRSVEWCDWDMDREGPTRCIRCYNHRDDGHAPDCRLAAALKGEGVGS